MATYRITYENTIESKKSDNKDIKVYQYCTIKAPTILDALQTFEYQFCWEAVKIQKIN